MQFTLLTSRHQGPSTVVQFSLISCCCCVCVSIPHYRYSSTDKCAVHRNEKSQIKKEIDRRRSRRHISVKHDGIGYVRLIVPPYSVRFRKKGQVSMQKSSSFDHCLSLCFMFSMFNTILLWIGFNFIEVRFITRSLYCCLSSCFDRLATYISPSPTWAVER